MSIATEIQRLQTAKADLKTAIEAKGVSVPSSATIDTYDDYVSQISGGGGTTYETEVKMLIERYMTSFNIPSGVTSIGLYAFQDCVELTSINIPNSVSTIYGYAFQQCSKLTSITIGSGVTSIGGYAFYNCKSVTNINIPSGVTSIGNNAFQNCSGLTSINIPSGVTSIGSYVFSTCSSLTSVTIPSGVKSIGTSAFYNCSGLTNITINATTPPTLSNINAFTNTNDCPIYVPSGSVDTYKAASKWSTYASRIQAIPT